MKTKKEITKNINELKREIECIDKILNNENTDYDVWKSLDYDLTKCKMKLETLEWFIS